MSELERLRALLVAPERDELAQHQEAIERLQLAHDTLPQRLPALLDQVEGSEHRDALHRVLAPVVAASLADAVQRDRRSIVDALFPIIGPAIRKAIAEALRGFVTDLNRALDYSLTPRGLRWRLESWRTGVPFAQVVMKHTLRYRIDHLFLIERESGLLLHRYTAPELPDLDADAIAGMLTAIGDFVRDSVQSDADTDSGLASATIGEHLLQVHEGPRAILACFIHGVPPAQLAEHLRRALEDLHRAQDLSGAGYDWDGEAAHVLNIADLAHLSGVDIEQPRLARWPMWLLLIAVIALLSMLAIQRWQRSETQDHIRAAVAAMPGWQLLDLSFDKVWKLRVLRDPDSEPSDQLAARIGLASTEIEVQAQPFLALDEPLVAARAHRLLKPDARTQLSVVAGRLSVSGQAERSWVQRLQQQGPWLPGITAVDTTQLITLPDAADLARLSALQTAISVRRIAFRRGHDELDPAALTAIQLLLPLLQEALDLAHSNAIDAIIRLRGWSDDGGSVKLNAELRTARAQALQEVLVNHGIPLGRLLIEGDDHGMGVPSASATLQLSHVP